jgi:hypothetical protein
MNGCLFVCLFCLSLIQFTTHFDMTTIQKQHALSLIDLGNFAEFFNFMQKTIGNDAALNVLKSTFIQNRQDALFAQQLRAFVDDYFDSHATTHSLSPFLTDFMPAGKVVGRQDDLDILHQHLQANLPTVVVNGIGGIGKTTFARKYATDYQTHYTHIVWLEQSSTLISALAYNERLHTDTPAEYVAEIARFKWIMGKLAGIQGNNLLVIDNYARTNEDEQHKILACLRDASLQHWRVLLTSREKVKQIGFKEMPLDILTEQNAIALFCLGCKTKSFEENELKVLLKMIHYHTLMIELLAKNYDKSWDLDSLQDLCNILAEKAIDSPMLQENVSTEHSQTEIQLSHYLQKIFNLSVLGEDEQYILQQMAVLPTLPIAGKDLLAWIGDNTQTYKPTLQKLAEKGWLACPDNRTFEMHRLVQMLVWKHLKPTIEHCENLFISFKDFLAMDKVNANPLAHQWLLEYGEALLAGIDFDTNLLQKVIYKMIWHFYIKV